jgi:hypothetical protein
MRINNPITIDGETYTHVNINLAISYRVTEPEDGDANAAMRIVPVRFDQDGAIIANEEAYIGKYIGSLAEAGPAGAACAAAIYQAIQTYLAESGVVG